MKNEKNLKATLQRSYYGKAKIRFEGASLVLKSYDTDVAEINTKTGDFYRLWNGWSATTAKHVNDFRIQNGLPALSKKSWLALPCRNNADVVRVSISNGWTCHTGSALLTRREAEKEAQRIKKARPHCVCWYDWEVKRNAKNILYSIGAQRRN